MFLSETVPFFPVNRKEKENCSLLLNFEEKTVIKQKKQKNINSSLFTLSTEAKTIQSSSNSKTKSKITPKLVDIPLSIFTNKKNNLFPISPEENYSYLVIKQIKNQKFSPYKSTSRLFLTNHKSLDNENKNEEKYFQIVKKKKVHSVKKKFQSEIEFINEKVKLQKKFSIYRDSDIGINLTWQSYIIPNFIDDDIESDDEEVSIGSKMCFDQLGQVIKNFEKKKTIQNLIN